MDTQTWYLVAADAILLLHVGFITFVVAGLALILAGKPLGWRWVRHFWFRLAHLAAIGIVTLQSWLGAICPLTVWEMKLRALAGDSVYAGAFVAYWLQQLIYYRAPPWVFVLAYSLFAALVVASWIWIPPRRRW